MGRKDSDKNNIKKCLNNFIQYYSKEKGNENIFDIDNIVFKPLVYACLQIVKKHETYEEECYLYALRQFVIKNNSLRKIDNVVVDELLDFIYKIFEINKLKHYLIFPLQRSTMKQDIVFGDVILLATNGLSEKEIIEKISKYIFISVESINKLLNHMKNTRFKEFLESNLMLIKVEHITHHIELSASSIAKNALNILLLLNSAYKLDNCKE